MRNRISAGSLLALSLVIFSRSAVAELHQTDTPSTESTWADYKPWVETWYFRTSRTDNSFSNMIQPRLYVPFRMDGQWKGMTRLDTSFVSNGGPAYPRESGGEFNPSVTKLTFWAISPEVLTNITTNIGARLFLPTGYTQKDYGSTQWGIAPQSGFTIKKLRIGPLSEFAPLFRYYMGVSSVSTPPTPLGRLLEIYPTVLLRFDEHWALKIWDQRSVTLNTANGRWFVPMDGAIYYYFNQHWSVAGGGSKQIVNDYPQYQWSAYGRIGYHF